MWFLRHVVYLPSSSHKVNQPLYSLYCWKAACKPYFGHLMYIIGALHKLLLENSLISSVIQMNTLYLIVCDKLSLYEFTFKNHSQYLPKTHSVLGSMSEGLHTVLHPRLVTTLGK